MKTVKLYLKKRLFQVWLLYRHFKMILIVAAKHKFEEHAFGGSFFKVFFYFNDQIIFVFETTADIILKINHHCVIFK